MNEQLVKEKGSVYLFGFLARQEEKHSSDIDIAIESPPRSLLLDGIN
ncbi:nucleotidyltransferase domain-containing protein [Halobacillus andaensis]